MPNLTVHLYDRQTNESIVYKYGDVDEFHPYIWEEGNYSCDCNRSLCFQRAQGKPEMEVLQSEPETDPYYSDCNIGPNRFVIDKIVDILTGETLYTETR